ncbi:hypothetical protein JTE90_019877 [Oedothorax gibbosus]|uniref:Uncharacterized protein n=1 Tax=Oedothorax gibbosus TaxID=931172 RepID=A0AAV6VYG9_9ARAC|nr:hypothetical protein JTE90_019877 [Oedothorax gibbosus]
MEEMLSQLSCNHLLDARSPSKHLQSRKDDPPDDSSTVTHSPPTIPTFYHYKRRHSPTPDVISQHVKGKKCTIPHRKCNPGREEDPVSCAPDPSKSRQICHHRWPH